MSQALYRKWRPQTWDEVVGQDHVVQTLRNALVAGRIGHAYLFAGPRGTGKTSVARLLAKAVNCLEEHLADRPCGQCAHCKAVNEGRFLDLIEIDAASNTSVEDVRDLRDKINFSPNQGLFKVYIIDEVHMLSTAAFNALLKTLEEPPRHAIFILATTEVHKIPATVLSRCQRHEFRRIPVIDIVNHLRDLSEGENIQIEEPALQLIARQATGSMRDSISLLDQLASAHTDAQPISLETTQEILGTAANQAVIDLVSALVAGDAGGGMDIIHATLDAGSDPRQFSRQIVDYLRGLLMVITQNAGSVDATSEVRSQMALHAGQLNSSELLRILRLFNEVATGLQTSWQPSLPLELAFVEALSPSEASSAGEGSSTGKDTGSSAPETTPKSSIGRTPVPKNEVRDASSSGYVPGKSPKVLDVSLTSEKAGYGLTDLSGNESDQLFNRVVKQWRQITHQVGQVSKQTQALLNSCKPFGVKDGVLFLGFNGDFSKTKMEKGENISITSQVIKEILGVDVPLRCFIASGGKVTLPADVESDGMVATALRELGGEVVDIQ